MDTPAPSATPENGQTAAKATAAKMYALQDQLAELRRVNLENASKLLDKIIKAHENGASFYEKLILFDVGTVALSLTLLEQIVAHSPGAHVPRHPFLWFLCPAWFLLLVSIRCCAQRVVSFHSASNLLIKQMAALIGENYMRDVTVLVGRIPVLLTGTPLTQPEVQDPIEVLKQTGEALVNAASENTGKANELIQQAIKSEKKTGVVAKIGIIATTLGLLLICIFAVQSILRM